MEYKLYNSYTVKRENEKWNAFNMEEHDLVICGNAYEEYLIDEVAEEDASAYLLQIMIQVKRCTKQ